MTVHGKAYVQKAEPVADAQQNCPPPEQASCQAPPCLTLQPRPTAQQSNRPTAKLQHQSRSAPRALQSTACSAALRSLAPPPHPSLRAHAQGRSMRLPLRRRCRRRRHRFRSQLCPHLPERPCRAPARSSPPLPPLAALRALPPALRCCRVSMDAPAEWPRPRPGACVQLVLRRVTRRAAWPGRRLEGGRCCLRHRLRRPQAAAAPRAQVLVVARPP
eukprot:364893-Chlamydomonas_euryale.AAC.5